MLESQHTTMYIHKKYVLYIDYKYAYNVRNMLKIVWVPDRLIESFDLGT